LIANPFAAGVAEATVASDDVPATNTIVATSFVKRLAFWSLRGVSPCDEPYYGPMADQCAIRSEWDNIQAANFVRTVEPARRPAGASGWGRPDIW